MWKNCVAFGLKFNSFIFYKENCHLDSPDLVGCETQLDFIVPLGKWQVP